MNNLPALESITNLELSPEIGRLADQMPEHKGMLEEIKRNLPEINRSISLFCKSQSQMMDNMLTVSHPTPLRNIRQIAAEINRTKEALTHAHFQLRKKEVELKMKKRDLEKESDSLKAELLEVEIAEIASNSEITKGYISGAIRQITNYVTQYNAILETHGLRGFNEIDFEREEEKYHIMKAFEQGICAARSHGGMIDEGNMIYLTQIGINGTSAQYEVSSYLSLEKSLIAEGKEPTHKMFLMFLERMAQKYSGCTTQYARHKGMTGEVSEHAAILKGSGKL